MTDDVVLVAAERWRDDNEPIHLWFELTYANYLVLPRSVLQSMPQPWQALFVTLLGELHEAFGHLDWPPYEVRALARECERIHEEACEDCDGEGEDLETGETCTTCNGDGTVETERIETAEEVGIITDPIPHYHRGRTRVQPKGGAA